MGENMVDITFQEHLDDQCICSSWTKLDAAFDVYFPNYGMLHYYIQVLSKFKSTCSLIDVIRGKKFSMLSVFERAAL